MARFLLTSSTATFGALTKDAPPPGDHTKQVPGNTYGFNKVVCEMMVNEYSRRGWVDGRGIRLPVIVVRPGAPNKALTTCWSSAVREPLNGESTTLPVAGTCRLPCASYQTAAAAMEQLLVHIPDRILRENGHDRIYTLPSLSLSPAELNLAAASLAEERGIPFGKLDEAPTELATRVVQSMGEMADGSRAQRLGLPQVCAPCIGRDTAMLGCLQPIITSRKWHHDATYNLLSRLLPRISGRECSLNSRELCARLRLWGRCSEQAG
eukprot:scaffold18285_cov35-Tisochrysis_lutea.AAC.9